jgi:hypothetical protein
MHPLRVLLPFDGIPLRERRFARMVTLIISRPAKGNTNNNANPLLNAVESGGITIGS